MAEKGARITLEPVARQMYVEGKKLEEIEAALGVSRQSISDWKKRTKVPGEEKDEWDKARERKGDHHVRMKRLFDRQMEWIEELLPPQITPGMIDSLSKMGALVQTTEKIVAAARRQALDEAAVAVEKAATQQGLNREQAQFWREQVLGVGK